MSRALAYEGFAVFAVTRFCVRTFARRAGALVQAEALEFMFEGDARAKAAAARKGSAGVALYAVTGEPGSGLWRRPRLLERSGEILPLG